MRKLFRFFSVLILLLTGSAPMAETELNTNFYVSVVGKGALYILRINDVNIWTAANATGQNFTVPVNGYLQSGENTVSLIQVPYWGADYPYGTPNPHYQVTVELRATDRTTQEDTLLTLFNTSYDMETEQLIETQTTLFGTPIKPGTANMARSQTFTVTDGEVYRDGKGPALDAQRVAATFTLPYEFPRQAFKDGIVMADTPELRNDLRAAYQRVHGAIQAGSQDAVLAEFNDVWDHAARVYGYKDVADFVSFSRALEVMRSVEPNGSVLQPLNLAPMAGADEIQFMGEGRLVRVVEPVITWGETATSEPITTTTVVFYRHKSGELRIGRVLLQ